MSMVWDECGCRASIRIGRILPRASALIEQEMWGDITERAIQHGEADNEAS